MVPGLSLIATNFSEKFQGANHDEEDGLIKQVITNWPQLSNSPIIAYYANNEIPALEQLMHCNKDINKIKKHGVHIFLFEPLCLYKLGQKKTYNMLHNFGFYSEFENAIEDTDHIRALELDSVVKYVTNNDITNATVYCCETDLDKLTYYTNFFNKVTDDEFFRSYVVFDNLNTQYQPKEIEKHFISTNWRFTTARCAMSAILCNKNANLGWVYDCKPDVLLQAQWLKNHTEHDLTKRIVNQLLLCNEQSPHRLDMDVEKSTIVDECFAHFYPMHVNGYGNHRNPVSTNRFTLTLEEYYDESFVDIVNESRFAQPISNISEKTLQAIQYFTPFILTAPPGSLRYLHQMGFQTFSAWWDESYDEVEDHYTRFAKVVDLVDTIEQWSLDDCKVIYKEMQSVLEHNFKNMLAIINVNEDQLDETPEYCDEFYNVQHTKDPQ